MARFLMIAYTTYMHDGRVKRHAEALAERGDHVDVLCLATGEQPITNGVNVIGLPMTRYRGESKIRLPQKLHAILFDGGAARGADVDEAALRRRDRLHDARRRHRMRDTAQVSRQQGRARRARHDAGIVSRQIWRSPRRRRREIIDARRARQLVVGGSRSRRARSASRSAAAGGRARPARFGRDEFAGYQDFRSAQKWRLALRPTSSP